MTTMYRGSRIETSSTKEVEKSVDENEFGEESVKYHVDPSIVVEDNTKEVEDEDFLEEEDAIEEEEEDAMESTLR